MSIPLRLRTSNMSPVVEEPTTSSPRTPARGRETRAALLQKLRSPQLVHAWDCWIERPSTGKDSPTNSPPKTDGADTVYKPHLTQLASITDVRGFWSLFNNLPLADLQPKTSCHLFHISIMPVWEDARNVRGGSWTFRLPRAEAPAFFVEICMLAVGEVLQEAVEDEFKMTFRDDICGVSFSPRNATHTLVSVWNRDGDNEKGIAAILETVLQKVSPATKPKEGSWYYKKHSEHPGFVAPTAKTNGTSAAKVEEGEQSGAAAPMAHIEDDVRKVRKILEELKMDGGDGAGAGEEVESK